MSEPGLSGLATYVEGRDKSMGINKGGGHAKRNEEDVQSVENENEKGD